MPGPEIPDEYGLHECIELGFSAALGMWVITCHICKKITALDMSEHNPDCQEPARVHAVADILEDHDECLQVMDMANMLTQMQLKEHGII